MNEKIKILYAEDSENWASMIKQILEAKEFEVEIARDGEEALQSFLDHTPDMVLLDIDMPGRNGWELIKEFKQAKEWIPMVLYTSHYEIQDINEAFGLGAEDFLSKAYPPEDLIERLRAYYKRAITKKEKAEILRLSEQTVFNPASGLLTIGEHRKILKRNESQLLYLLYLKINQEADKEYLCEGIWGKGMDNETKHHALKSDVSNLRKYLSEDPSLKIINKRWGGYFLIRNTEK